MELNRRILVVDDQADLREQVARLLRQSGAVSETQSLIDQIRQRIARPKTNDGESGVKARYQVDTVAQGREAYEKVKAAWADNEPYACIFLDMRMPPGWDGLETAQRIRGIDKQLHIVIMTAYADHDQREIVEKLGDPDKLIYLKKPFHPEELRQLALAMTEKWNMNRRESERMVLTNRLMRENAQLRHRCRRPAAEGRSAIVHAFAGMMDTPNVGLVERLPGDQLDIVSATKPEAEEGLRKVLKRLAPGVGQFAHTEKDAAGFVPIMADGFTGGVLLSGLNSTLSFQELTPFLEILSETAAEVLSTAIHGTGGGRIELSAERLRHALQASRLRSIDLGSQIRAAANHLCIGQTTPVNPDVAAILRLAGEMESAFDDYLRLFSEATLGPSIPISASALLAGLQTEIADQCLAADISATFNAPAALRLHHSSELTLILNHLTANAVAAMSGQQIRKRILTVAIAAQPEGVRLEVSDTGAGIDGPRREGYGGESTARGADETGRGLGTRLVVLTAKRLGGTVQVSGDGGTTVSVHLPTTVIAGGGEPDA